MIKVLFIILIIYAIYKLVKGGYVAVQLKDVVTPGDATASTIQSMGSRAVSFLKSVF